MNLIQINGKHYEKCKVVMLETDKAENCFIKTLHNTISFHKQLMTQSYLKATDCKSFHLYILSDSEIKEGDWFYSEFKGEKRILKYNHLVIPFPKDKKIIACTDSSLWEHDDTVPYPKTRPALPQLSKDFIQSFVDAYNRGTPIIEVLVEYEFPETITVSKHLLLTGSDEEWAERNAQAIPKISQDNTITIKQVKDTYTREEVVQLCEDAFTTGSFNTEISAITFNEWITNNL